MDTNQTKTKLIGYGFSILENVDPNPDNFVSAAIVHTSSAQIGCLLRLEPNLQAHVSSTFFKTRPLLNLDAKGAKFSSCQGTFLLSLIAFWLLQVLPRHFGRLRALRKMSYGKNRLRIHLSQLQHQH